jgi:hypothetical protein
MASMDCKAQLVSLHRSPESLILAASPQVLPAVDFTPVAQHQDAGMAWPRIASVSHIGSDHTRYSVHSKSTDTKKQCTWCSAFMPNIPSRSLHYASGTLMLLNLSNPAQLQLSLLTDPSHKRLCTTKLDHSCTESMNLCPHPE